MFIPLLDGIPGIRSRRGPRRRRPAKLHADEGCDADHLRDYCRRLGIESYERLSRWRWKIERSISWAFGYRRLTVRFERKVRYFAAFLSLAATLACFKRLAKRTK